jgi:excisionase family DNA binding protein
MHNQGSILVSVPEFAARTSLSARHIWRLIRERRIPSHLVGRRRVIPLVPALNALLGETIEHHREQVQ